MSIYVTVLMTLERFHTIGLKRLSKKQGNQRRVKFLLIVIFVFAAAFNIPKSMEYTWETTDIRTNYDLKNQKWTAILNDMWGSYKNKYKLNNEGHLAFLKNHRDVVESGVDESESYI